MSGLFERCEEGECFYVSRRTVVVSRRGQRGREARSVPLGDSSSGNRVGHLCSVPEGAC